MKHQYLDITMGTRESLSSGLYPPYDVGTTSQSSFSKTFQSVACQASLVSTLVHMPTLGMFNMTISPPYRQNALLLRGNLRKHAEKNKMLVGSSPFQSKPTLSKLRRGLTLLETRFQFLY